MLDVGGSQKISQSGCWIGRGGPSSANQRWHATAVINKTALCQLNWLAATARCVTDDSFNRSSCPQSHPDRVACCFRLHHAFYPRLKNSFQTVLTLAVCRVFSLLVLVDSYIKLKSSACCPKANLILQNRQLATEDIKLMFSPDQKITQPACDPVAFVINAGTLGSKNWVVFCVNASAFIYEYG